MLWIKAFHVISMVAWFAAIFYLPRLFVYHASTVDEISNQRFKIMERRLYRGIMWPSAVLTTLFGGALIHFSPQYYLGAGWFHLKLMLVLLLWGYHLACGHYVKLFLHHQNHHTAFFYRVFNEIPTILLISIVILVEVKPF